MGIQDCKYFQRWSRKTIHFWAKTESYCGTAIATAKQKSCKGSFHILAKQPLEVVADYMKLVFTFVFGNCHLNASY